MTQKRYGISYKGSKNAIVNEVVEMLPKRDNLYDLFCGGGAIIQRCLELKKYKHIYANDLNKLTIKALKMAFNGEFKNETRWISREEFKKLKNSDPYVAFCFSFGSSCQNYAYGTHIEPWKKALHYARVFNDFSLLKEFGIETDRAERMNVKAHYEEWRNKYIDWWCRQNNIDRIKSESKSFEGLESLERLQRLQRIETFPRLVKLTYSSKDYREIKIKKNSCIYCDIPYANDKKGYIINGKIQNSFDYEAFYDWCEEQTEPLLISSYVMPKERFNEYFCKDKRVLVASAKYRIVKQEKLFYPKTQEKIFYEYKKEISLFMDKDFEDNEESKLVELIGHYGNDETITNSARMSYNSNKEHTQEENEALLRLMLTNGHTSPFEQVNFTFKLHMPIFVARQWQRHRTAKINEQSARYTKLNCEFFKLEKDNLRTINDLGEEEKKSITDTLSNYYENVEKLYNSLLDLGIVKEQARTILPLATYTTFIWQMDLHNLMHFLKLRCSEKAQKETREYAEEVLKQIEDICPITIKLFKEIVLNK